jgi:hypothetical protein
MPATNGDLDPEDEMDSKRLLRVTAGNLRQNHLYISEHLDFSPDDVVGKPKLNGLV